MSDLISRKALLKKFEGKNSYSVNSATTEEIMKSYAYADAICLIEHEPTAYDTEKVIEKLKEASYTEDGGFEYADIDAVELEEAIVIVKGGGQGE